MTPLADPRPLRPASPRCTPSPCGFWSRRLSRALQHQKQDPLPWNGTYSAEQAQRGEAFYAQNCIVCHGQESHGRRASAGGGWPGAGRPVARAAARQLLDYMQTQMPMNSPGGLTRHHNADILAFMLDRSGATPGSEDLWIDGSETRRPTPPRSADYGTTAVPSNKRAEAFYNDVQAERGRLAFNRQCAYCHTVNPTLSTPEDLVQPLPSTFGGHFVERVINDRVVYPHALALYSKFQSMPAHNTRSITDQHASTSWRTSYTRTVCPLETRRFQSTPTPCAS